MYTVITITPTLVRDELQVIGLNPVQDFVETHIMHLHGFAPEQDIIHYDLAQ